MAKIIRGNQDGTKGENITYNIPGRGINIPRPKIVKEIKDGKHPGHIVTKINDVEYVKAKPNPNTDDNVNKK